MKVLSSLRRNSKKLATAAAVSGALFALAGSVLAATVTTTFNVTATVLSVCSVTATNLAFGNYTASNAVPTDVNSTVSVTCSNATTYTTSLDAGLGTGATVANRFMKTGVNQLGYGLYTTAGRTTIWGDGTLSTVTQAGTGNGGAQAITVFGRIPINQYVTAGAYSDTITATVTY